MEKTLVKGLEVLEALAASSKPRGVSELALELGLTKSNTHRLLLTLHDKGFVARQDGRYSLSLRVWELGSRVLRGLDVKQVATTSLTKLAAETSETVHLAVLTGADVIYIDKIDSSQPVRAYSEIGGRAPAHCVATGKALLAHRSADYIAAHLATLREFTPTTLSGMAELEVELAGVRERGFSVNQGEWRESVWGLAAPIWNADGQVTAAVGISGPADRIRPLVPMPLADPVLGAARAISAALGFDDQARRRPPPPDLRNAIVSKV